MSKIAIGTPIAGGFYAGSLIINGTPSALIVSPRAEGDLDDTVWNKSHTRIEGALSFFDGLANTNAMAEAGSELAIRVRALRIGGFDDWHIPAQDQLELAYRHLKPGTAKNWLYNRSGINVSALPPTYPYTADFPVQTSVLAFREDGPEAFDLAAYWSSTQHAADSSCAWYQYFSYGYQGLSHKSYELRARAVRTVLLSALVAE